MAFKALSELVLFVPAIAVEEQTAAGENVVRVRAATYHFAGKKYLPVFTKEELLYAWSDGSHESMQLPGDTFFESVPPGVSVTINPGTRKTVELSFGEVEALLQEGTRTEETYDREREALEQALAQLFIEYPEVIESYILPLPSREFKVAAVTVDIPSSRRITLVSEVGEVSKDIYGKFGAVQFLDDSYERTAPWWSDFAGLQPFYRYQEPHDSYPTSELTSGSPFIVGGRLSPDPAPRRKRKRGFTSIFKI